MIEWIPSEIRWLSRQVRPFLRWHVASFSCITVGSFLALLAPLILKWLIDVILPSRRTGLLIGAVGLIFLCHQGRAVLTSLGGYLTMLAAERLALDVRLGLLRHLDTLSADYHERTPLGVSMYPLKEPIDELAYFGSDLLPSILRTLMATMLTLGTMVILDARMTLAVLPLIPVFLLTRKHFRGRRVWGGGEEGRKPCGSRCERHGGAGAAVEAVGSRTWEQGGSSEDERPGVSPGLSVLCGHDCGSGGGFDRGFAAEDGSGDESNDKADGQGFHEGVCHVDEGVLVELLRALYGSDLRGGVGGVKSGGLDLVNLRGEVAVHEGVSTRRLKDKSEHLASCAKSGNTKLILNGNYSIDEHISNNGRSDRAAMVIGEFDATDA
ncbi:MAG TPA: ABC transporter ATP-binding protein [Terriglobales bacterium]|nr:ABC transporter ATP-binding protein [Terriglobales bacterium]